MVRGWCHKDTEHKLMDPTLAIAITDEVDKVAVPKFQSRSNLKSLPKKVTQLTIIN